MPKTSSESVPQRNEFQDSLEKEIYAELVALYGVMIGGDDLRKLLGFKTMESVRKAAERSEVELPIFMLPGRRSHFALTREAARWIAHGRRASGHAAK